MPTLTATSVDALRPRRRPYEVTCAHQPGFIVRVLPSGKKAFYVRHRTPDGDDRRVRIGLLGPTLSVDDARAQALLIMSGAAPEVSDAPAPSRAARRGRKRRQPRADAPRAATPSSVSEPMERPHGGRTVRELAQRFLQEYVEVYLKPNTQKVYELTIRKEILPRLGNRDFETVTRSDARRIHAEMRQRPGRADYTICVLGSLYSRIINDWELSNMPHPTSGIRRYGSRKVERFLTPAERRAVEAVLERGLRISRGKAGHIEPFNVWAIRLLMLTGFRKSEVLDLTWPMVDWQHGCIHFPDTKNGQRTAVVSPQVLDLLRHIQEETGHRRRGRVLRNTCGGRLDAIYKTWDQLRKAAGIPDVRLHDLRHSFASDALMAGVPLAVVGELLGHRNVATTQRYAHLADNVVREGLASATARILSATQEPPEEPQEAREAPRLSAGGLGREQSRSAPYRRLSDAQWARVAPLVTPKKTPPGRPVDRRSIVDGIRWVLHHDAKWREVPPEFGSSTTCWRWYQRWEKRVPWRELG